MVTFYGKETHYVDFVLGSILIRMLRTNDEEFEKVVKAADIQDWWKNICQYMQKTTGTIELDESDHDINCFTI